MAAPDPSTPGTVQPEAARAAAEDIVSRPEFQRRPPSLLSRFFEWLGDQLPEFPISSGGGGTGASGWRVLGWLLLAALVVAVVVLLVRSARGRPLPFRGRRKKTKETDEVRALDEDDAVIQPGSLAALHPGEVDVLEAAGRWRDALLARYRGAVADLSGAGLLEAHPGTSSAELLAAVDAHDTGLREPFARLTATFETVWYGGAAADEALAAEARMQAQALDAAVGSAARQKPSRVKAVGEGTEGTDSADSADSADIVTQDGSS
ncbi:MAG: DUF4129 domain-containing protein [Acidimicrobiales bacterium]